jgi:hypothetical protein
MRIANRHATQNIAKYKAMKVTRPVYGVVLRSTSNPTPIEIDWLTTRLIRKTTSKRMGRPLGVDCALPLTTGVGGINGVETIRRGHQG